VIVIDEAQNLSESALELLRMLSSFETPRKKMMQIILAGQPQLAEKLASPNLVQLRQRISIVARLKPFSSQETNEYVGHRLRVAGYDSRTSFFTPQAGALIAEQSGGIPRNINNICFNALSLGCALKRKPIDEEIIREVIADLDLHSESLDSASVIAHTIPQSGKSKLPSAWTAAKPGLGTRGRLWVSRLATAAVLMLTLLWPLDTGHGNTNVLASQTEAVAAPSAPSASGFLSVSPSLADSKSSATATTDSSTPETSVSNITVLPGTARPSSRSSVPAPGTATRIVSSRIDPSELWKEVGNGSTTAEIALAGMYFGGTVVPQNCSQARVLLMAASKKGNKDAESLLHTYEKNCQ
jgi:hypothetical protein